MFTFAARYLTSAEYREIGEIVEFIFVEKKLNFSKINLVIRKRVSTFAARK